jgi:hypothetical protein
MIMTQEVQAKSASHPIAELGMAGAAATVTSPSDGGVTDITTRGSPSNSSCVATILTVKRKKRNTMRI